MFYKTTDPHGLPHDPFKSCIVPRPIGWISTVSADGVGNLAPFSFFNGLCSDPPMVMFAPNGAQITGGVAREKDSLANVRETKEFVVNIATWDLKDQMNASCAPVAADVDEMELAGLTGVACELIEPVRVKQSPIAMECTLHQILELPCNYSVGSNNVVIGRVVGIHIDLSVMTDGLIDISKMRPIARLGYMDYAVVNEVFSMKRPGGEPGR